MWCILKHNVEILSPYNFILVTVKKKKVILTISSVSIHFYQPEIPPEIVALAPSPPGVRHGAVLAGGRVTG